ncbi:MAG: hypothetical protein KGI38_01850 [Thaumarchaeota archaeon]|nr:hypothetical protein [Nitrososphaerota archaeon]
MAIETPPDGGGSSRRYFPRMIGLTPQSEFADGKLFELLVVGNDEFGALARLTALLAKHNLNIIPSGGYQLLKPRTFVWTTFLDFSNTKTTQERFVAELKQLPFVTDAEVQRTDETPFDLFLFPVIHMGMFRSAIFSTKPLLGVERRLIEQFGPPGGVILFEEGRQYLTEALRQLGEIIPSGRTKIQLDGVGAWLRATGWGIFEFDDSRVQDSGEVAVTINEPSFVEVPGLTKSNFLNGVAAGVVEFVYGKRANLQSEKYDPGKRRLTLVFRVSRK